MGERGRRASSAAGWAAIIVVTVVLAAAPYVWLYGSRRAVSPVGWDTPTYVWRTRLVARFGVEVLRRASPYDFHSNTANADRPGLPAVGALVSPLGVSPWRLMFCVPAIAAVVAALAAGAFAVRVLREPPWAVVPYGVAIAWSPQLAVTANGYLDNLVVAGVALASLASALALERGHATAVGAPDAAEPDTTQRNVHRGGRRRGLLALTAVLFAGTTWIHWIFAAYAVGVLAATAALWWLGSLVRTRSALRRNRAAPLVGAAVVASVASGLAMLVAPGGPMGFAAKTRGEYVANLANQLPYYRLSITLPLAALGVVALLWPRVCDDDRIARGRGLLALAVWLAPLGLGWAAFAAGRSIPIQRLLGFSLPIALLGAAAVVGGIRLALGALSRLRLAGTVAGALVGAAVVAAVLAALWTASTRPALGHAKAGPDAGELLRTHLVMRSLGELPRADPIVFVADGEDPSNDYRAIPAIHHLRAAAPAALALRLRVYVGDPTQLLAGRPTTGRGTAFDRTSLLYWSHLSAAARRHGAVVAVAPYYPFVQALARAGAGRPIAPDARVLRGAVPSATSANGWRPRAVGAAEVAAGTAVVLLVLAIAGLGWSTWLGGRAGVAVALGTAPATGLAVCVGVVVVAGRAGVAIVGARAAVAIAIAVALGWALAIGGRATGRWRRDQARPTSASSTRSTSSNVL